MRWLLAGVSWRCVVAGRARGRAARSRLRRRITARIPACPLGDTTASVTRRTLSESSTVDGTLGYGTTLELYDRLAGTFTWLPSVGAVIGRGGTLWRIDDLPVALMYGSVPAYRTLKQGVSDGPDVAELNENLIDLGFDPYGAITDDESFSEATAAAVKRWQKAEGLPETGEVELGRVVFAPGARRVTAVKVTLGQDPPARASRRQRLAATNRKAKPAKGKPPPNRRPPKKNPPKNRPAKTRPAEKPSAGAGEVVLSTTSTQQLVQLKVKPEQQQLAKLGETVTVQLPGGGEAPGRVTEVGTVASESSGSGDEGKGGPSGESGESHDPRDARARASRRPPRRGARQRRTGQEHPPRRADRPGDRADRDRRRRLRRRSARETTAV